MSEQSGPITREQVERAIAKPRNIDYRGLGAGWRDWAPDYVIAAEAADDWDAEHAALTRWRDELAAAEPVPPEVVDVPQPRIVVKRCDEVEAEWTSADATILIVTHDALDDAIFVPIALLRAMLAAIDAQQGGAS